MVGIGVGITARWRSWPRWKWLVLTATVVYVLGVQPVVDFSDPPATSNAVPAPAFHATPIPSVDHSFYPYQDPYSALWANLPVSHRRLALYITVPRVRVFDVDFASGRALGFGLSATN
jgi:hypothetical protein